MSTSRCPRRPGPTGRRGGLQARRRQRPPRRRRCETESDDDGGRWSLERGAVRGTGRVVLSSVCWRTTLWRGPVRLTCVLWRAVLWQLVLLDSSALSAAPAGRPPAPQHKSAPRIFSAPPPPHTHRCGAGGAKRSGQVPRARPAAPIRQKCAEKGLRAPTTRATYYIYVDTQRVYIHGSFGTLSPFIYSFIYIGFCDLPPSPFMYKPTGKGGGSLWSH